MRKWRMGRDSNPRCPCGHTGFRDQRLQPLGHPSIADETERSAANGAPLLAKPQRTCKRGLIRNGLRLPWNSGQTTPEKAGKSGQNRVDTPVRRAIARAHQPRLYGVAVLHVGPSRRRHFAPEGSERSEEQQSELQSLMPIKY